MPHHPAFEGPAPPEADGLARETRPLLGQDPGATISPFGDPRPWVRWPVALVKPFYLLYQSVVGPLVRLDARYPGVMPALVSVAFFIGCLARLTRE